MSLDTRVFRLKTSAIALAVATALCAQQAGAFGIDSGDGDLKVRWDNTLKYTTASRLQDPDQKVAASLENPNVDNGDLAFNKGIINNRVDLLSEFDAKYQNFGFRVSGAAWYDAVYMKDTNDFPDGLPPNNQAALMGGPNNRFSDETQDLMGRKAEILDAFILGNFDLGGETALTVRAGQHTLLFGETLFLGANGIAAAQGPVDLIKAFSLPNAQFKEIAIPVNQISGNLQLAPDMSLGFYNQFEWQPLRVPAAGSYFSAADFVGAGGDLLLHPGGAANKVDDLEGDDSSQYGLRFKFNLGDTDYGIYAARYHEKAPIPVLDVTVPGAFGGGVYKMMYAKDISVFGASFSTVFGETNVAGELSTRRNTPLAPLGDLLINTDPNADNEKNTPYARGNTLHLNLSAISVFAANSLWDGASLVAEYAYNRLLDVTHNPTNAIGIRALNTTHTRDSSIVRFVFQPEYFQVMQGVDIQVPIGVGYGISGRSAVLQLIPEHGGDFSIGVNVDVRKTWRAALQYTQYFGDAGPAPSLPATGPEGTYASYKQFYADRDFVSLTVQRTF